jgi:hypothetical protein
MRPPASCAYTQPVASGPRRLSGDRDRTLRRTTFDGAVISPRSILPRRSAVSRLRSRRAFLEWIKDPMRLGPYLLVGILGAAVAVGLAYGTRISISPLRSQSSISGRTERSAQHLGEEAIRTRLESHLVRFDALAVGGYEELDDGSRAERHPIRLPSIPHCSCSGDACPNPTALPGPSAVAWVDQFPT